MTEAAALHACDELFSKHTEPEPAPDDPVEWAMAEALDDKDDAPMPDALLEPELIDMPPAPASALPMSTLERCIALCLVYGAGPRQRLEIISTCITSHRLSLCCLPCRLSRVSWPAPVFPCPDHQSQALRQ